MQYFKYVCDTDNYDSFVLEDSKLYQKILYNLDGTRKANTWSPLSVELYKMNRSGDFPHLTSFVPVFSQRGINVLMPLIGHVVELLPLVCPGCESKFSAIHILDLVDCIDYRSAQIERDPDGEIMFIDRYAFIEEKIHGKHIFRIKEAPLMSVIVSSTFVSLVNEYGLEGLIPKLIT